MNKSLPQNNLIKIEPVLKCFVINRENRFVVNIELDGKQFKAHTNNTGRMLEFMHTGQIAYITSKPIGKTDFRLFAFHDNHVDSNLAALVDTRFQMQSFEIAWQRGLIPWLNSNWQMKSRDYNLYGSRIDYLAIPSEENKFEKISNSSDCPACPSNADDRLYIEVKSAAERGIDNMKNFAMYPDCPSTRGQRHIKHLTKYQNANGKSAIVFVCALPSITAFIPNKIKDPQMMPLLYKAAEDGVCLRAISIHFEPETGSFVHPR